MNNETIGMLYGLVGGAAFHLTRPTTHLAVADLSPTILGLGRALAAGLGAGLLLITRLPEPRSAQGKVLPWWRWG